MPNQNKLQNQFQQSKQKYDPKPPFLKNILYAFLIGGTISLLGQCLTTLYIYFFDFTEQTAANPTVATIIFLTMLVTGLGLYDKIAQVAGAGTAVPVSGFGNVVISSAIDGRTEGFIVGVGTNMLRHAGPVIVYGVFSAFIIALIKTILQTIGVI